MSIKRDRSPITTHILDISRGVPAAQIEIILEIEQNKSWKELSRRFSNQDGRVNDFLPLDHILSVGTYRLSFAVAQYFRAQNLESFYPYVQIVFEVRNSNQHYHVPLLLSPYGYSTYRGS